MIEEMVVVVTGSNSSVGNQYIAMVNVIGSKLSRQ